MELAGPDGMTEFIARLQDPPYVLHATRLL